MALSDYFEQLQTCIESVQRLYLWKEKVLSKNRRRPQEYADGFLPWNGQDNLEIVSVWTRHKYQLSIPNKRHMLKYWCIVIVDITVGSMSMISMRERTI